MNTKTIDNRKRHRTVSADKINKKLNFDTEMSEVNKPVGDNAPQQGETLDYDHTPSASIARSSDSDPAGITTMESIAKSLSALHIKFDKLQDSHETLDTGITGPDGLKNAVGNLEYDIGDLSGALATIQREQTDIKGSMNILTNLVIKQSETITELKHEIVNLKSRSMRRNVLLHNIAENTQEDCDTMVGKILVDNGYKDPLPCIERAHRLGSPYNNRKAPRPIVVRLLSEKAADDLITFGKKLPRDKERLKITPQYPPEVLEARSRMSQQIDELKTRAPDTKFRIKMTNSELFINGEKQREGIKPPTTRDMLQMSADDRETAIQMGPTFFNSDSISEKGSNFRATLAAVNNISDVRRAYIKLLCDPVLAGATHNVAVYRLSDANQPGSVISSFYSDGEHGAGRHINYLLQRQKVSNVVVFISRIYGGAHLGYKRFQIMEKVLDGAIQTYKSRDLTRK